MNISLLKKDNISLSRNTNSNKYYISCEEKITKKTPTTSGWIKIIESLKITHDYDKSRVLLALLDKHTHIIVKLSDSSDLHNEYMYGERLKKIKGFVKYICYFECNDDFRKNVSETTLCKGVGNSMKIIVMPYFKLGSIASYKWDSIETLHSCLKHSILSILQAFFTLHIIHGDFHPGNVVLKETKLKELSYNIPTIGVINVPIYKIRPWIMDFENSSIATFDTPYNKMVSLNNFYQDFSKFFLFLSTFIKNINFLTIQPIIHYISIIHMKGNMLNEIDIHKILEFIDSIELL